MNWPFGVPVTIVSRGAPYTQDADGNSVPTVTETVVPSAVFADAGSSEVLGNQDTVTSQPIVYLPAGTVVGPADAVTVDGVTYEVDGSPNANTSPFTGWSPGIVVKLKMETG